MIKLHYSFPLKQVFEFKAIKQAKSQKDIPTDDNGVPYVVQSTVNNMVARFVNRQYLVENDEAPVDGNAIVLGVTLPVVSYQKNEFGASQVITARSVHLDERTGLYLVGVLSKYIKQFSYQRKPGMAIYKSMEVSFPVVENPNPNHEYTADDIDWQYMRDRIETIERDCIQKLDAYLQATGLNDYELTIDEEMALKGFFDNKITIKKFKIEELFAAESGDTDIQKSHINGLGIPVISSGVGNRGVIGNSDIDAKIINKPSITVDMFGNVFYRDEPYKMVTHARVFALKPLLFTLDRQLGEFFETQISKACAGYGYNNMCSFAKIHDKEIDVPVNSDGSINFAYIYIYISSGKRDNQESCPIQRKVDECLQKCRVRFGEFSIGDLFLKVEAKCQKPDFDKRKDTSTEPDNEFIVPLVNARLGDNGIMFYGRQSDWNTQSMCIDVIQNGAVATGKVYVQPQPTAVLWDAYLIKPIAGGVSEEILLYLAMCIEKLTKERFSYEKKATWDRIKECQIQLPVKSDGTPDFDYMERYIRAIEKMIIADVVKYKDK